jgi:hypothetical protein
LELFQQLLFLVKLFLKLKQLFPGAGGDVPKAGEALHVAVGAVPGGAVYEVAALPGDVPMSVKLTQVF